LSYSPASSYPVLNRKKNVQNYHIILKGKTGTNADDSSAIMAAPGDRSCTNSIYRLRQETSLGRVLLMPVRPVFLQAGINAIPYAN
ncbi:MAG: hypothetical protein M1339_01650, partial [Bacteroidetes bacterium]|nr:hypothetical protein [Bacteroidota bacterium]